MDLSHSVIRIRGAARAIAALALLSAPHPDASLGGGGTGTSGNEYANDRKDAVKRINDAGDAVWTDIDAEGPFLVKLLTPGQIRLLPAPLFNMISAPNIHNRFFFGTVP